VTAASLLVVGVAYLLVAVPAMNCTRGCTFSQSYAALISAAALALATAGIAIGSSIRRRPVQGNGDTDWTWALGVLFIVGMLLIAARIPQFVCPDGVTLDANVSICIDTVHPRRFPPSDWIWLKRAILGLGVLLGLTVVRSSRWVWIAAPVAAATWFLGAGWLLFDSFLRLR